MWSTHSLPKKELFETTQRLFGSKIEPLRTQLTRLRMPRETGISIEFAALALQFYVMGLEIIKWGD